MARSLILAAPASGSGKTTVTLALLRYLARQSVAVSGAKVGPDYIDPGFHAAASRRPSINLDPWAMRRETIAALIGTLEADFVLCEGVMGLFDGAGRDGSLGSTADLAALTGWPVVLIVDASGQSASVAALLEGFARHRPGLSLAGVIFNRTGSARHAQMLSRATSRALPDLAILGAIPLSAALELPSRHLGLVPAEETTELEAFLDHAADIIGSSVDVPRLTALTRPYRDLTQNRYGAFPPLGTRIALARDAAFAFVYPHLIDGWRHAGAEILPFSPLMDEAPDAAADAVFAQQIAAAAQAKILVGDAETIIGVAQQDQAAAGVFAQTVIMQQQAEGTGCPAPHPAAQLVQLRQAKAFGVFDHHDAGGGHVHPDLDHRGRHQGPRPSGGEILQHPAAKRGVLAAMRQPD